MDVATGASQAPRTEATTMTKKPATEPSLRRCIGTQRFAIEPHEAPIEDFPRQPSQRDGLGRMCKAHWNLYTAGLAREAKARKAATEPVEEQAVPATGAEAANAS
jgi:hypothetical protein